MLSALFFMRVLAYLYLQVFMDDIGDLRTFCEELIEGIFFSFVVRKVLKLPIDSEFKTLFLLLAAVFMNKFF